jgi:hypothetical protein
MFKEPMPCVECKYYRPSVTDLPDNFARCGATATFADVAHLPR